MIDVTLERVKSLPVRERSLRSKTKRIDQDLCFSRSAIFGFDDPSQCVLVKLGTDDSGLKSYILSDL